MTGKAKRWVSLGLLAGIVSGGVLGHYFPGVMLATRFLGSGFIGLLMIVSFLTLVTSLINGTGGLGDKRKLGFSLGKTLSYFMATSVVAGMIAIALGLWLRPGAGVSLPPSDNLPIAPSWETAGLWLGAAVLATIMALAMLAARMKSRSLVTLVKSAHEILVGLSDNILMLAPIGGMSYVGALVAEGNVDFNALVSTMGSFGLTLGLGLAIYLVVILPLSLVLFGGGNLLSFFSSLLPAALTSISMGSSRAALPLIVKATSEQRNCDERAVNIAVPMGSLFNVGPTLVAVLISAMFLSQGMGVELSIPMLLVISLVTIFLSIGSVGAPGTLAPILALALMVSGAPVSLAAGVAVIVALSWFIEPLRALANVYGDASAAAVLSQTFEFKTALRSPARALPRKPYGDRSTGRDRSPARGRSAPRREGSPERSTRTRRPAPAQSTSRPARSARPESSAPAKSRESSQPSPFDVDTSGSPALEIDNEVSSARGGSRTEGRSPRARRGSVESQRSRPSRSSSSSETPARGRSSSRSGGGTSRPSRRSSTSPEAGRTTEESSSPRPSAPPSDPERETTRTESPKKPSFSRERIENDLEQVSKQLRKLDENLKPKVEESSTSGETGVAKPVVAETNPVKPSTKPDLPQSAPAKIEQTEAPQAKPEVPVAAEERERPSSSVESNTSPEVARVPVVESEPSAPAPEKISAEERQLAAGFGRSSNSKPAPAEADKADSVAKSESADSPQEQKEPTESTVDSPPKPVVEPSFGRTKRKKRLR